MDEDVAGAFPFRECNCPAWILRCAHWKANILILADQQEACLAHAPICRRTAVPAYTVDQISPSAFELCFSCGRGPFISPSANITIALCSTLLDAQEAFAEHESELLERR